MPKAGNKQLGDAKKAKKDEFYTQLCDIERELRHYEHHFKGKTVLCNCDDPRVSNFFHYFSYKFEDLGLKRLITTCYKNQERDLFSQNNSERAIWLEYLGDKNGNRVPDPEEIGIRYFNGDGDFRSDECIELLKQADIVVTNPPFSLFIEYIRQLVRYDKKFLVIGPQNAIHYKDSFELIRTNKMWLGTSRFGRVSHRRSRDPPSRAATRWEWLCASWDQASFQTRPSARLTRPESTLRHSEQPSLTFSDTIIHFPPPDCNHFFKKILILQKSKPSAGLLQTAFTD